MKSISHHFWRAIIEANQTKNFLEGESPTLDTNSISDQGEISSNAALIFAWQGLIYDTCPDRKWTSKKILKYFLFQPLVFPVSFENMGNK